MKPDTQDRIANVALVFAVCVLGAGVWLRYSPNQRVSASRSPATIPFRSGDRAPAIRGIDYNTAARTLVVFVSTTCHYCESSVPFYNQLRKLAGGSGASRRFVAVFSEPIEQVQAFKARSNLAVDVISGLRFRDLGIRSTPSALLVGRNGIVERVWVGTSEAIETGMLKAMGES